MQKTIAIVDDDDAVRDSLSVLLSAAGYRVFAYRTGTDFLEQAKSIKADCVILDNQMGETTGVDLAEQIAKQGLQISSVIVSGNLSDAARWRARAAGVRDILEKPFSDDVLIAKIEAQTERH